MAGTHSGGPGITADEALRRLIAGNLRFRRGQARFRTVQKDVLIQLAREQHPFATILGCSDSRVPPELLFDAEFGELFVIRVAGNTLSPEVAGSMQYAATHLHTPLFVVLGHERCGAVAAALQTRFDGARHGSRIDKLVDNILPAIRELDPDQSPQSLLEQAVEANVRYTVQRIRRTPEAKARKAEGRIKLVGAVYCIQTGSLRILQDEP